MATTPEGKVKKAIKKILDEFGEDVYYFMPSMNGFGKAGVPDFVCCVRGIFFAIEAKADKDKNPPTQLQLNNLDSIDDAGGIAAVVDAKNIENLKQAIQLTIEKRTKEIEYARNYLGCRDILQPDTQPVEAKPD